MTTSNTTLTSNEIKLLSTIQSNIDNSNDGTCYLETTKKGWGHLRVYRGLITKGVIEFKLTERSKNWGNNPHYADNKGMFIRIKKY